MDEMGINKPGGPMSFDSSVGWRIPIIRKAATYLAALAIAAVILSLVLVSPRLAGRRHSTVPILHLWINYSRMGFLMGIISEKDLREEILCEMFGGELLRIWWARMRGTWIRSPGLDRRNRQFARIIDEEYSSALAGGPPLVRARQDSSPEVSTSQDRKSWDIPASMALGVAIGIVLRSRRLFGRR